MVGRETELAVLSAFLDQAARGPPALVLVGEAGIGKTSLWQAGLSAARERGFAVLACAPTAVETGLAYAALGDLFEDAFDDVAPSLPVPGRRALERALFWGGDDEPASDQRSVSLAVLVALRELAGRRPTLVAIDDLQWLDASSARVLHFALRRVGSVTLRILATARSGAPPEAVLPVDAGRLEVGPLERTAVDRLIDQHSDRRLLRSVVYRINHSSGGNPLFALELLRAAEARGCEPGGDRPIPESLRALVSERLARLPARRREALLVVAALSRPTASAVEAALEGARGELEAAVDAGIIQVDRGRLRFAHPLLASVVYAGASAARLRMLHRRLARVADGVEEQARHLALAASLPNPEVAARLDLAAASASARGASDAAADLCEEALRLTSAADTASIVRRTIAAAEHRYAVGEIERAGSLLVELADGLPAGPERAEVLRRLAAVRAWRAGWREAIDLLERALAEAGDDVYLRAAIECDLGHVLHQHGDLRRAEPHARLAVELAIEARDEALLADARVNLATVRFQMGVADPGGFEPAAEAGDGPAPGVVHRALFAVTWRKYSDDFDTARGEVDAVAAQLRQRYEEGMLAPVLFVAGELEIWAGNLDRAEALAAEAWDAVDRSGQVVLRARLLYLDALLAALRGRIDDSRRAGQEGLALAADTGDRRLTIRHLAALGFLELSLGDAVAADAHLARARETASSNGYGEPGMFRFAADGIEALIALGQLGDAEAQLRELETQGRRLERAWALATAARCRGLLLLAAGEQTTAVVELEAALDAHERLPQPIERARTQLALGAALRLARKRRLARQVFADALAGFERIGTPLWAEKVRTELARIGGRVSAGGELTATEQHVASLVATGKTNKEVAAELFLTVRTIEGHLSRIYAKLGVRSRAELARRLTPPG